MNTTLTEQIAAVKQVANEKRGAGEVALADALQGALATLVQRSTSAGDVGGAAALPVAPAAPRTLYKQFEEAYHEFHRNHTGLDGRMDGAQGVALNSIIAYLRANNRTRDDAGALRAWKFLLDHWHQVGSFIQKQKALTAINKYLVEALEDVRKANGTKVADKKAPSPAVLQQRKKLDSELDDARRSLSHLSSCEPYDGIQAHYEAAEGRVHELETQLQQLA
jgi:hypothetical protein